MNLFNNSDVILVSVTSSSDTNMPMMMLETRQQNTEVRVSLSKISDKVDRLSEKVRLVAMYVVCSFQSSFVLSSAVLAFKVKGRDYVSLKCDHF